MDTAIITINESALSIANTIAAEITTAEVMTLHEFKTCDLSGLKSIIFIGALGICVRSICNRLIKNKYEDPGVVCVDTSGRFAISVASGHIGGANELTRHVASIIGAQPVVTTQSDNAGIWALDTLERTYGWACEASKPLMRQAIYTLVSGKPTALILDVRDKGTNFLRRTVPDNVKIINNIEEAGEAQLIIAVTTRIYRADVPVLHFHPKVLTLGLGCRKGCNAAGVAEHIKTYLNKKGISPLSIKKIATIDIKAQEPLLKTVCKEFKVTTPEIYTSEQLANIKVANPSEKVYEVTGVWGVAESTAIKAACGGPLVVEKQKGKLSADSDFTFAVAQNSLSVPGGHIEIVGAGPGDPELVSVRGRHYLSEADLILYAGSLVPRELTFYAKDGCVVRNSASMTLEEQFALMKDFYDRGLLVVRLHTGDPCIYGAIQEQMAFFDKYNMEYHITPGISSFQAAAAALRSQFTIPEKVQTIILTRGEGRTPMPEKEKLCKLAQSQSTMCIYLSAGVVDDVQSQLLQAYSPDTPVAACYKLTWKDERIYRGQLKDLAKIVHDNNLTLTTLLVVGDAIDNREGLSRLYSNEFKHLFRK